MKRRNFKKHRDDKQELTFWRGLPYSMLGLLRPQGGKWRPAPLFWFRSLAHLLAQTNLFNVWRALHGKFYQEQDAFTALQKGDERGLDFFFNRYYTPLTFFSTSITNNKSASQEIVSETFVKLWRLKETVDEWKSIRSLLYRIVRNASIDYTRAEKSTKQAITDFQLYIQGTERSMLDKLIETETYHRLHLLISNLPEKYRQVFKMFYFQDKALKEIAKELGLPLNTVRSQKQRALQLLKDQAPFYFSFLIIFLFTAGCPTLS